MGFPPDFINPKERKDHKTGMPIGAHAQPPPIAFSRPFDSAQDKLRREIFRCYPAEHEPFVLFVFFAVKFFLRGCVLCVLCD
jgi:hypothetical protein